MYIFNSLDLGGIIPMPKPKVIAECYCCNEVATTREHVPPRCFFPKLRDGGRDLRKNLLSVPSCALHNTEKTKDDEYLLNIILMGPNTNGIGNQLFETKGMRAIDRNPNLMIRILEGAKDVWYKGKDDDEAFQTYLVEPEGERLQRSIDLLARALHFHQFGEKWNGSINSYPEFMFFHNLPNASESNHALQDLSKFSQKLFFGKEEFGNNPEVFSYQIHNGDQRFHLILRLRFYGGNYITIFFDCPPDGEPDSGGVS